MIDRRKLIEIFRQMWTEHWEYKWGACEKGCTDCAGAFVYAYKQLGQSIGVQGSNWIARMECGEMLPISQAKPGMAAFKSKDPSDSGYALPDRYKVGGKYANGDWTDYYHIGLIDDDTGYVLNAQSTLTGFQRSKISRGWSCCACLNKADYGEEKAEGSEEAMASWKAEVVTADGNPVKLRKDPSVKNPYLDKVENGTLVEVYSDAGGWSKVKAKGKTGYIMSGFLSRTEGSENADAGGESDHADSDADSGAAADPGGASVGQTILAELEKQTENQRELMEAVQSLGDCLREMTMESTGETRKEAEEE